MVTSTELKKQIDMERKLNSVPDGETLHEQMEADSERCRIACEDPETYVNLTQKNGDKLNKQLSETVKEENKKLSIDKTCIGPFIGNENGSKRDRYKDKEVTSRPELTKPIREINSIDDIWNYSELAYHSGDAIVLPEYKLSPEVSEYLKDRHSEKSEYLKGNSAAELAVYFHELNHYNHEKRGQSSIDSHTAETEVALNYITEKTAHSAAYLSVANLWKECKNSGIETLQMRGKDYKVDEILDMYPGLKETVLANGFDPKDPKTISPIVKLASEDWDKERLDTYCSTQFKEFTSEASGSLIQKIQAARETQIAQDDMLKDIQIGHKTKIDIPEDCVSLMKPSSEFLHRFVRENTNANFTASNDGLLAIDKYLDEIGLKNDKQKDAYLTKQYECIVNRSPDADLKLQELMLACDYTGRNQTIVYTDNLTLDRTASIPTVSNDNGKTTYPLTPMDEYIDNRARAEQNSSSQENLESPHNNNTSALSLAQLRQRSR